MTKLRTLRANLSDLRRRRRAIRWGTGWSAALLAALVALFVLFLIDWQLEMSRAQRLAALAVAALAVYWAARRYTLPWLGKKETDLDMALLVERQQKIDSDLVAALQFESPDAPRWGSPQLERTVIDYVADYSRGWNVLDGMSRQPLVRRAGALLAAVALLALGAAFAPGHAAAFLNRLLLGSAHYPTHTQIARVLVNGRPADLSPGHATTIRSVYGDALRFEVRASGELPTAGHVDLRTSAGLKTKVDLARDAPSKTTADLYRGQLPKLVDSVQFQLRLGDAWTDPAEVRLVALPAVELRLLPEPPEYARSSTAGAQAPSTTSRQISVIEGSSVAIELTSDKPLEMAELVVGDGRFKFAPAGGKVDGAATRWRLSPQGTPLAQIVKPTSFAVRARDIDKLGLESPLAGSIRIKADQRPRVTAEVVTRYVLPSAKPLVEYRVSDDYGLSQLAVRRWVQHADGTSEELGTAPIRRLDKPLLRERLPLRASYSLDLGALRLVKGDQLKISVEAVDYRGTLPGQTAGSEPIVLQVTDESGVLAAISESDERSARQLDAIIKRQLGIGDSK